MVYKKQTRRDFVKTSAMATASAMGIPSILKTQNVNDKIRVGFIGVGNRGTQLLNLFKENNDVHVAALCDVYEPYLNRDYSKVDKRIIDSIGGRVPQMGENLPDDCKKYKDFRQLLEDKSIDAVCIATPDHWHAIQTIVACLAGKDVYVEKPLTKTIVEGRQMINIAKETNRIVSVGLNRRGSPVYQKCVREVQHGKIGFISIAMAARISNMFPNGIGKYKPADPPDDFDWDMWLGPQEFRPYQFNIAPYKFRWWSDYSSQMGNWGVHYMDVIRWILGEKAPVAVTAFGTRNLVNDDATIPDTMEVLFEYASGTIVKFSINEACGGTFINDGEIEIRGTKGNLVADENGYKIFPAKPGQFQTWLPSSIETDINLGDLVRQPRRGEDSTARLIRNFLDCVKSRETPLCPLEEGHRSTTFAHLANIALTRERRLEWDGEKEEFINDREANKMLHYKYRKPWKLD